MTEPMWSDTFTARTVVTEPCECGTARKMIGYMVCRRCFKARHRELAIQRRADNPKESDHV